MARVVVLKVLKRQKHSLSLLVDITASMKEVIKQCTPFLLACYAVDDTDSSNETRYNLWMIKVIKNIGNAPKLQSLPPKDEVLRQNVARAHFQVAIWRNSLEPNLLALDPVTHGCSMEDESLSAVMIPPNHAHAPAALINVIKCSCKREKSSGTRRCSSSIQA